MRLLLLSFIFCAGMACMRPPAGLFSEATPPPVPDYSDQSAWAVLPDRVDAADVTPGPDYPDQQATAEVDVFFLHPTIYSDASQNRDWNGSLQNEALNDAVDKSPMQFQASLFNGVGRVYAPRYRQAHLSVFYPKKVAPAEAKQALALAYSDVRAAFQYYLEHYNQGRPIIIAGHSQGALHGETLLKEFFDGKPLAQKLVVAYVVGWPIREGAFQNIPLCETPQQTGCYCAWRTFKEGFLPEWAQKDYPVAVVNPVSWTTGPEKTAKSQHQGAVLRKLKVYPQIMEARIANGVLWTNKPKFPGSFLMTQRNYHVGDVNLFYLDIRKNVAERVAAYQE